MHEFECRDDNDRKFDIAIVLSGMGAGGTERIVSFLANHWANRGGRVTIVSLDPSDAPSYYSYDPRVTVHRLSLPPGRYSSVLACWMTIRRLFALRAALRAVSPDMVLSFLTRTNVLTLLATVGMKVPVVVSERNNPALQVLGRVWRISRSILYRRAFGMVTMTKGALTYFPEAQRKRSWVIHNPVNLLAGLQDRRGGNVLTAVGRFVPQKGFDLLLQAFAQIAPQFRDWKLVIWGEGQDRAKLEVQRDLLGLQEQVQFPGVSASPAAWIETADVFVLSSRYEGWGIALLEAMAAGLPVASFDCEWGPGEMISHNVSGLLVPRGDVAAMADALASLLGDAGRRAQLGAAAQIAVRSFDPEDVLAKWDGVVRTALAHSERPVAIPQGFHVRQWLRSLGYVSLPFVM